MSDENVEQSQRTTDDIANQLLADIKYRIRNVQHHQLHDALYTLSETGHLELDYDQCLLAWQLVEFILAGHYSEELHRL